MKIQFYNPLAPTHQSGTKLPHWHQNGACYFITFRLADSLPQTKLTLWKKQKIQWLSQNPQPWNTEQENEYYRKFSLKIEQWLDLGSGECPLKEPALRTLILDKLLEEQGEAYFIHSLVIMPNHLHVLVSLQEQTLQKTMKLWKGATGFLANQHLGRLGSFWQRDYFDRLVRSAQHFQRCVRYIEANPKKARLRDGDFTFWCAIS